VPLLPLIRQTLLVSGFLITSTTAAEPRQLEVTAHGERWEAREGEKLVHSGDSIVQAIQAAVDGLTPDRDWKETVHIRSSGTITGDPSEKNPVTIRVPSHTILDFHGNGLDVQATGGQSINPIRAQEAEQIEILNLRITGNPSFGIFMKGCEEIVLRSIHMDLKPAQGSGRSGGGGIRTEGGGRAWSGRINKNFVLDDIHVANTRGHGIELWRTDGLTAGTITTRNTGYAGLLLNQTKNAKIALVDAHRANPGGGYAGFRTANNAGPNIVVEKVIAVECGRGVFTVSGSHGITIREVDIARSTSHGMLIEDTQDFTVHGGTIADCRAEGVRINSRGNPEHHPASRVTVQNLRIFGCSWGIRETLPRSNRNQILDNDLRGNRSCLLHQGEGTVAKGNLCD
jgi:hypothetical protein